MKRVSVFFVLVVVLLVGCNAGSEATPWPTETSTVTPWPTRTLRMFPSPTRYITQTPVPSLTPTLTLTPYPTSAPPPFPTPDNVTSLFPSSLSPTGKWIAWQAICQNTEDCFVFINKEGTQSWFLPHSEFSAIDDRTLLISIVHWSKDNRFVYLELSQGEIDFVFPVQAHGLIKYSLVNGNYSYLITPDYHPEDSFPIFYSYSFSNSSQMLVYSRLENRSIDFTTQNLYTGETNYISVIVKADTPHGDIAWSPDDRFFVFSTAENLTGIGESDEFSVYLVNVEENYAKQVLAHGDKFLNWPEWISDREVQYDYWTGTESGRLILNIETGEVTEVQ